MMRKPGPSSSRLTTAGGLAALEKAQRPFERRFGVVLIGAPPRGRRGFAPAAHRRSADQHDRARRQLEAARGREILDARRTPEAEAERRRRRDSGVRKARRAPARDWRAPRSNTRPGCAREGAATASPPRPDVRAGAAPRHWSDRTPPRRPEWRSNRAPPAPVRARRRARRAPRWMPRASSVAEVVGAIAATSDALRHVDARRRGTAGHEQQRGARRRRCAAARASRATGARCRKSRARGNLADAAG